MRESTGKLFIADITLWSDEDFKFNNNNTSEEHKEAIVPLMEMEDVEITMSSTDTVVKKPDPSIEPDIVGIHVQSDNKDGEKQKLDC